MFVLAVQGPVSEVAIGNILKIAEVAGCYISHIRWAYTSLNDGDVFQDERIEFVRVADPGAITISTESQFSNTNRLIKTSLAAVGGIGKKLVIKLRSDFVVKDEIKFIEFLSQLERVLVTRKLVVLSRANHQWDLPYNLSDWCLIGEADYIEGLFMKVPLVQEIIEFKKCWSLRRFVWGYIKKDFTAPCTAEQYVGRAMFDAPDEIYSLRAFCCWIECLSATISKRTIESTGLCSHKYPGLVGRRKILRNPCLYALKNITMNMLRAIT
jgi:hypothetical protein